MLFRAGDDFPIRSDLTDCHAGHAVRAFRLYNRVGQIERNAAAGDLRGVHTVAADARCGITQSNDVTARLHELKADDQADVAGAQHEHALTRQNMMQIHHGLCGTGADDARQCPALEVDHVFRSAGCNQNAVAFVVLQLLIDANRDFPIRIQTDNGGIQNDFHAVLLCFREQLFADLKAADFCLVLFRAKKFMNLLKQLTARLCVFIEYNGLDAMLGCFDRGG